jgi:hypothetical protein
MKLQNPFTFIGNLFSNKKDPNEPKEDFFIDEFDRSYKAIDNVPSGNSDFSI